MMTDDEKTTWENSVRERAYFLWLEDGCPEGQALRHWQAARQLLAIESESDATLIALDNAMEPAGESLEVAQAQGDVPGLTDQGEKQQIPVAPQADEIPGGQGQGQRQSARAGKRRR